MIRLLRKFLVLTDRWLAWCVARRKVLYYPHEFREAQARYLSHLRDVVRPHDVAKLVGKPRVLPRVPDGPEGGAGEAGVHEEAWSEDTGCGQV